MHALSTIRTLSFLIASMSAVACSSPEPQLGSCVVPLGDSPARGPADAWVTIVEFGDFQCSYCGRAEATIAEVDAQRPGLRWVYKHFPLTSVHPNALAAAQAADCAGQQGQFWAMHDRLYSHQTRLDEEALVADASELGLDLDLWNSCRTSNDSQQRIVNDFNLGLAVGIDGTPTFFVNGIVLPGAVPASDFYDAIEKAEIEAQRSGLEGGRYYSQIEGRGCSDLDP
jgi:protein-disulfide isomerase